MSYEIRHEGLSISTIWWSERPVGTMVAGLGDSWAEAWDQLCDEDATMGPTTSYPCSSSSPCGR